MITLMLVFDDHDHSLTSLKWSSSCESQMITLNNDQPPVSLKWSHPQTSLNDNPLASLQLSTSCQSPMLTLLSFSNDHTLDSLQWSPAFQSPLASLQQSPSYQSPMIVLLPVSNMITLSVLSLLVIREANLYGEPSLWNDLSVLHRLGGGWLDSDSVQFLMVSCWYCI